MSTPLPIPLPWHQTQWQSLLDRIEQQRLPHALLFKGPEGSGKIQMALAFAAYLLCGGDKSSGLACGQCKSCQLFKAGTHPDFKYVAPEEGGKVIKIDQVRALVEFVNKTAQLGGSQVVVLAPAESMNIASSNALLKSLEEPTAKTQFVLVSHMSSSLMATIRSRCQTQSFPLPNKEDALTWLQSTLPASVDIEGLLEAASGAPLLAAELLETELLELRKSLFVVLLELKKGGADVLKVAAAWKDAPALMLVTWWQSCVLDCVKWLSSQNQSLLSNRDQANIIASLAPMLSLEGWFAFNERLQTCRGQVSSSANPNLQMLWEDMLISWQRQR